MKTTTGGAAMVKISYDKEVPAQKWPVNVETFVYPDQVDAYVATFKAMPGVSNVVVSK